MPPRMLLLLVGLALLTALIQINLLAIAFDKLGLSPHVAMTLVLGALFGSAINLPLVRITAEAPPEPPPPLPAWLQPLQLPFEGTTLIAVNLGGCIIPVGFSAYLMAHNPLPFIEVLSAIAIVTFVSYRLSRPIPRMGIAIPVLVAPVTAALTALLINAEHAAPLAYISGTLGVLTGADLLRLGDIRKMGTPLASIGGAGTFDGIFITGIVAALLA
ncbi:MAG TPA: DUF1614 domain-containing protein [Gammaproteobacteria bacterium]|nr:DUF1614 domain-containing protein [Gammaproteobacteria bacterium]